MGSAVLTYRAPGGGGGGGGTVAITTDRTSLMAAPDSARFGVDLSASTFDTPAPEPGEVYDLRLHRLVFLWDTGDTGVWSAVQNVLPGWNDKSRAKGPWFSHMYTQPGSYFVYLQVIEPASGKTASASTTVEVQSLEEAYPTTQVTCINAAGSAGATGWGPAGATYVDWDDAQELAHNQTWWAAANTSADRAFLFNPAQTYTGKIGFRFDSSVNITNPFIGVYGVGRAELSPSTSSETSGRLVYFFNTYKAGDPPQDFRLSRISGFGTFDPTTELSNDPSADGKANGLFYSIMYLDAMVSDCRAGGYKVPAINIGAQGAGDTYSQPCYLHVDDTRITDMGGQYGGIYLGTHDTLPDSALTVSGVGLVQNPLAIEGGEQHRAQLRENGMHRCNIRCSEVFGLDHHNSGWKLCTTPDVEIGQIYNLDGVMSEGNYVPLHFQQNASQGIGRSIALNAIADGVVIVGDYATQMLIESYATGVTLRNVLGIVPDSPRFASGVVSGFDMNDEEVGTISAPEFSVFADAVASETVAAGEKRRAVNVLWENETAGDLAMPSSLTSPNIIAAGFTQVGPGFVAGTTVPAGERRVNGTRVWENQIAGGIVVPATIDSANLAAAGFTAVASVATYTTRAIWHAVHFVKQGTPSAAALAAKCEVYNCTFLGDRSSANGGTTWRERVLADVAFDVTVENNVFRGEWAAEVGGVADPDAPLDTTALWTPYCAGFKGAQTKTLVAEFATPAGAVQSASPLAGSAALGGATTGLKAYFDISGQVRGSTRDRGAWNPSGYAS